MDLRHASLDEMCAELARRDQPFFMILTSPNSPETQFQCSAIPPRVCKELLQEGANLMSQVIEGGKIPDNVRIMRRITNDGKVTEEVEVTEISEDMFDPWDTKNKIGDYNPWEEKTEEEKTEETEKTEKKAEKEPEPPEDKDYDPWKGKE